MIAALSMPCMARELSRARPLCAEGTPEKLWFLFVARKLVIKVTAGEDEPERCNQAFTVAAAGVASGVQVSLWLTGEAAWFALPGRAEDFSLPHAAPLADLLGSVLALGTVTICGQCAARRDITPEDVIAGIRIAGAATFVSEVTADDAQALVY
jgi:predicted peroxiredoxin